MPDSERFPSQLFHSSGKHQVDGEQAARMQQDSQPGEVADLWKRLTSIAGTVLE